MLIICKILMKHQAILFNTLIEQNKNEESTELHFQNHWAKEENYFHII